MSKITTLIALVVLALAIQTQTASAEPENPLVRGNLDVTVAGGGKVTGAGIDCGTDCSETATWRENELPPKNRLTATPNTGWRFGSWTNCAPVNLQPAACDATYSEIEANTVGAQFVDIQSPSIFIAGYSSRPGQTLEMNLTTSDNDRVDRVEILINGQVVATKTSDYWNTDVDVSEIPEDVYSLQARAYDPTGNNGTTVPWELVIDHTGPAIELGPLVTATSAPSPGFTFDSPDDDFWSAHCAIYKQGDEELLEGCFRNTTYSQEAPTEGNWRFVVVTRDSSGNENRVEHDFVVDRTAPVADLVSGPANDSEVRPGTVEFGWTVTDGLPVTQTCVWDNGEEIACEGSSSRDLTAGPHSFKVVFSDQAGNKNVLARTFTVKKAGGNPDPDPDPDPDTSDRTAPVVKLVAPKQKLRSLGKALRINVRCNEACAGRVVVTGKGGVRFAGRIALAKPGVAKLKLRPTAKVRKRLAPGLRSLRPLALTARAALKDKAGNAGKAALKFRVAA